MQKVHNAYEGQDFASFIIDLDGDKQKGITWIAGQSYNFTEWGWDPTSPSSHPIFNAYNDYNSGSTGIPQCVIIDADGNVRYAKLGMLSDGAQFITVIDELI